MVTQAPVLIVDGNPQMTAMLQRYLAQQRIDTQAASSLADAQAVLAQQIFGVVLTDAFLPSSDGLNLLRYIHQTVPSTRGIFMTAFRVPPLWQQAFAEGAYACPAKPFRLQELLDLVQAALQGLPAPEASRQYDLPGPGAQRGVHQPGHSGQGRGESSGMSGRLGEFHDDCGASARRALQIQHSLVTLDNSFTDR
jgi:DNA-binding NtrC family response regulator